MYMSIYIVHTYMYMYSTCTEHVRCTVYKAVHAQCATMFITWNHVYSSCSVFFIHVHVHEHIKSGGHTQFTVRAHAHVMTLCAQV